MNPIFTNMAAKGLMLILLLSLAPLLASLATGLIVSLIQALTQVQEQTLTFVPKMIITVTVLILSGAWIMQTLVKFTLELFKYMGNVGKLY